MAWNMFKVFPPKNHCSYQLPQVEASSTTTTTTFYKNHKRSKEKFLFSPIIVQSQTHKKLVIKEYISASDGWIGFNCVLNELFSFD